MAAYGYSYYDGRSCWTALIATGRIEHTKIGCVSGHRHREHWWMRVSRIVTARDVRAFVHEAGAGW